MRPPIQQGQKSFVLGRRKCAQYSSSGLISVELKQRIKRIWPLLAGKNIAQGDEHFIAVTGCFGLKDAFDINIQWIVLRRARARNPYRSIGLQSIANRVEN